MIHTGACHCGAIRIALETGKPLAPRACMCSFCRKHGARTVSDPDGRATLSFAAEPIRYRFATRGAVYVVCATCGVYVAATAGDGEARRATLNLNAFDDAHAELGAVPVSYDGETAEARAARRVAMWTPLRIERHRA